jgi:hypothetical protein
MKNYVAVMTPNGFKAVEEDSAEHRHYLSSAQSPQRIEELEKRIEKLEKLAGVRLA